MAEKSSTEISRDTRLLFQKGSDALQRENYDYAIDLFNQVLVKEPAFFDGRKALRTAQIKKTGGGGGFFKKVLSSASSSPLVAKGQMALRKNPAEAIAVAEQILNHDPQSSAGHRLVVEAARAMEMPRTVALSLEVLARNSPKDKAVAIEFANALGDIGDGARGEKFLSEFLNSTSYDNEVVQALKDLSARKTLGEKGYQSVATGQGSYRDILKDKKEAVSLEQEKRVEKGDNNERLIQEWDARLKTEPNNLKLLRNIAETYTTMKQYDRALEYYERAKGTETGSNDPTLDGAIAEIRKKQFDLQIEQVDKAAPDYNDKVNQLKSDKLNYQMTECQKRVEKYPTDLVIRFEMGALYFQAGKIGEAIQEFQKAQNNPNKRLAAMNYLAQCFAKRKMYDMSAKKFQEAIKEKPVFDDEKKELIYNLGSVFESMEKKEDAIEQFKQIYEVDASYRDVAEKVEKYYGGQ
jgi:tetratricopeptide (TPR) repeat protein